MLGLNPKDQDDLAKQLGQVLHFFNDHEVALIRSLEPFHRLVWLYLGQRADTKYGSNLGIDRSYSHIQCNRAGDKLARCKDTWTQRRVTVISLLVLVHPLRP